MAGAFDDLVPGSGTGAFDDLVPAKKKPGFLEGLKQFGTRLIDTEVEGIAQRRRTDLLAGADRSNAATQAAITRESTSLNPAEVEQATQATQANTRFQSAPANVLTNAAGAGADLAQDLAVSGAKGVVGFGESVVGLADLATGWTGYTPGGVLKDLAGYDPEATKKFLEGFNSDRGKADNAGLAKTKGFVDTLAELGGNPRLMAQQIFEALPGTIGSGAIGGAVANRFASGFLAEATSKGLVGAAAQQYVAKSMADNSARITKAVMLAAAAGEGAQSAGSIAETARQAGRDWEDYILPALGAGVGTAAIGLGAGKLATKLGVGDIETDIALRGTGLSTGRTGPGSLPERVVVEGLKEGLLEEAPQSAQEAGFENVALGRPWDQGIAKATAMGLATGAGMGGGHAALSRAGQKIQEQAGGTPVAESQAPAPSGPGDGGVAPTRAAASPEPTAAEKALLEPRNLTALDRVNEIDQEVEAARTRLADLNNPGSGYGPMFDAERAELASKAVELETERQGITKNWPAAVEGKPTDFSTEAGARVQAKYALMDVGDLQTSHDADLRPNPVYPTELQPRERERAASEMQISGIVQKLDPARLGLSADAANGAPIVGADGLVESGNARTIALKRIYQANGQKAADYKQFLKNNAAQFGLTPEQIDAAAKPVLVRVRTTPVNRAEFARQANASTVAMMSPSEQGKSDANRIDSLEDLVPDESGDFTNAASRPFIRRFMARLPVTEQAGMIDSAGNLSTTGYARVRNAVLAKAYGDSPVLMRMTESMDDNLRNVSRALMMAAPKVAQMREAVSAGNRFDADITPDLMAAVEELSRLKESGTSVEDALAQAGMFGDKYSPETRDLLQFLAENARRPRKMADFLVAYMAALDSLGDPNQGDLLGDTQAPAKSDLMAAAKRDTQDAPQKAPQDTQRGNPGQNTQAGRPAGNQSETALSRGRGDQGAGPAGSQAGEVGEGWALFGKDSGTLGIPRAAMPQIKGEQRGALVNFLAARGIEHTNDTVPAKSLKPTQAEYSRTKVDKFKETGAIGERSVLVSSDGHVLDGHHQWLGMAELGQDIPVIRLGAPIVQLLDAVNEFPSVRRGEGGMTVRDQAVSDFKAALADLAQIATRQTRAAMIPEETPKLMDTLVRLFDAAIKIVGSDMKAALRYVKEQLRKDPENKKLVNFIKDSTYQKAALQAIEGQGQADPFAPAAPTVAMIDGRPYDPARDNFKPPRIDTFLDKAVIDEANANVEKYYKNRPPVSIPQEDRARAEALLAPLMEKAAADKVTYDQKVIDIAKRVGALGQMIAPLKGIGRAAEKLVLEEGFNVGGMKDTLRSTIVVSSYDDVQAVLDEIVREFKLLRDPKNRTGGKPLTLDGRSIPADDPARFGGYSDVMVNIVMPSGVIAEIQINVPEMLGAKEGPDRKAPGHKLYEAYREAPKETPLGQEILGKMLGYYAAAFAAAAKNSASVRSNQVPGPRESSSGRGSNVAPSSESANQRPSGNSTTNPPSLRSPNRQPAGNLFGSLIDTPTTDSVAQKPANGYSAAKDKGENDVNVTDGRGRDQGKGAGTAQAADGKRRPGRVRAGTDGPDLFGDGGPDAGAAPAGAMGQAGPDGVLGQDADGGGAEPGDRNGRSAPVPAGRDIPAKTGRNYEFGPDDLTYAGSWAVKAAANVDAVELVKRLEAEGRQATREEQAVLAKFIGWGSSEIANTIFGNKLDKVAEAGQKYRAAIAAMDAGKKDVLKAAVSGSRFGGGYRQADDGYYDALAVMRYKFPGFGYDRDITREDLEKNKPDAASQRWVDLRDRLKAALTPAEWAEASRSTQYAHYTSKAVVKAMWGAMERMGFKGGAILEPGAGIGVFPGLMPSSMAFNSAYTGIEFDGITGAILKQLFPDERILVESFVDSKLPKNFYDVAAGNPPFSPSKILGDPEYAKQALALHDYFFAKTIDRVKPGGLVMFVSSRFTMDKLNDKARQYLAERADLVGAIRLPQTAFKQNAGTDVVTDVLFLRKKVEGEKFDLGQPWAKSVPMAINGRSFPVNEYFHAHPEMVLGTHSDEGSMQNSPDPQYTVKPLAGDIEAQFAKATESLPADIYKAELGSSAQAAKVREIDFNPNAKKEGNYYVTPAGVLMVREGGVGVRVEGMSAKDMEIVKDIVPLRDALKQAHYDQLNDGAWEQSLAALQAAYAKFTKKNGAINQFTTRMVKTKTVDEETGETYADEEARRTFTLLKKIEDDPDWTLLAALENVNDDTGAITPSAFLSERVLGKPTEASVATPTDALLTVLNDVGSVDIPAIAHRINLSPADTIEALGTAIYQDPSAGWLTADEYLSGNVKRKLKEAREAARADSRYERNVTALEAVQPAPLEPSKINAAIGMNWIPGKVYQQFLQDTAGVRARIEWNARAKSWIVEELGGGSTTGATDDWGTTRRNATQLMEAALTGREIRIETRDPQTKKASFDAGATELANQKLDALREEFQKWLWKDQARTTELVQLYNDKFNTTVPRSFDGRHLTLPGTSKRWSVFDHVKRGAWRIIQSGNTYLAHAVGSGKTFQMVISAMEQKRLGLIKKPMVVVPNHMLQQFAREWQDLYPAARLMVADENNFHTDNRRRFVSRVALSDLDGVIITQSAFKLLDLDPEFKQKIINQQLDYMRAAYDEAGGNSKNLTLIEDGKNAKGEMTYKLDGGSKDRDPKIKQIERQIERMEQKLMAATSSVGKDTNARFDELGVDFLYVDEAHNYRKLDFTTNRQVKGISPGGSDMALDLFMKSRFIEEKRPGRSIVMASGTPVTNTIAELFTVQKFMDYQALEDKGIEDFDSWAAMFGREVTALESNAAGKYEPVTRFAKFANVPELTQMFREFADVLNSDHLAALLGDKRPKVEGGSRKIMTTPETAQYMAFREELEQRVRISKEWKPSKDEPNNPDPIIKIIGDGRLAAIDMRFMRPGLPNDPDSKLNRLIDDVIRVHKETAGLEYNDKAGKPEPNKGAAMMVFSDLGFGAGVAASRGFNARAWFEKRLRDAGVPMAQVAFMSDYKKSADKLKLFKDVNAGRIRILVGSSKNMGTGVNAQQRLKALFHLDSPWYPADLEQREGRIVRQGNKNPLVQIYAYAAKGSYDETMWGMLARKQYFIDQALSGDENLREIEDLDSQSQYALVAAMVAKDPRVLQLAGLRADIAKMMRLYEGHEQQRAKFRNDYWNAQATVKFAQGRMADAERAAAKVIDLSGDKFTARAGGKDFTVRTEWAQALIDRYKDLAGHAEMQKQTVGSISGYNVVFSGAKVGQEYSAQLYLDTPEAVGLVYDADTNLVGMTMRATNALSALANMPAKLRERIQEARAVMDAVQSRLETPFPMAGMLADKVREADALEAAIASPAAPEEEMSFEDALAGAALGGIPPMVLSRGTGGGMDVNVLQAIAQRIKSTMPNMPTVRVLRSPADAPKALRDYIERQGAWNDVDGAMHKGELYLFASGLPDAMRAEHVLAEHEAAHFGLRAILGSSLNGAMQIIYNNNPAVRRAATALQARGKLTNAQATEEVLVDIPTAQLAKLTGWRKVVAKMRDSLAARGYEAMAGKLSAWLDGSLTEQQRADLFAADLVRAARGYVAGKVGGRYKVASTGTRLSGTLADDVARQEKWLTAEAQARGYKDIDELAEKDYPLFEKLAKLWRERNPADMLLSRGKAVQTDMPDFKAWFKDSKVVNPDGTPMIVYHGTNKDIKKFDNSRPAWFAVDHQLSNTFVGGGRRSIGKKPGKGAVMYPVYLRIENPLDLTDMHLGETVSMSDILEMAGAPHGDDAIAEIARFNLASGNTMVAAWVGDPVEYLTKQYQSGRLSNMLDNPGLIDALKRAGVDGLHLTEEYEIGPARAKTEAMSDTYAVFDPSQIKSAIGNRGTFDPADPDIRMSRAPAPATTPTAAQRAEAIIQTKVSSVKPIDALVRGLTRVTGIERMTGAVYNRAAYLLDRYTPEQIKAGVVSDYGVPESVIDQRAMMQGRQRVQLRQAGNLLDKLSTLTREESRVAYEWMNETDPKTIYRMMQNLPDESVKVLMEVQQMIDKLSKEAVRMGQLSPEAYEANKFAYLRRSYAKYTLDQTAVEKAGRARAISILGDQYRGRGLTEAGSMKQIQSAAPEWWKRKMVAGKADVALKGEKFVRMERRAPSGTKTIPLAGMTGKQDGKLLEVQYHPVGAPMPARYADWNQAGTFQVRDVKGDQVVLWRDFTKDERERMGEIDEARFAIAKTLQGMVHDVEVGRYLEWLAHTQAKKDGETIPGQVVEASEGYGHVFKPGEWVKVPDSKIAGTSVLKYGKLAGRYLPGPVWNDLRQVVGGQFRPFGETYGKLLSMWKTSKTALSPAVHTNNIMSNLVMADWHDVTAGHTAKALRILLGAHARDAKGGLGRVGNVAAGVLGNRDREASLEIMNRYLDSGGDIGSWATNEISQDQISPLLEQLERELATTNGGSAQAQVGIMAALQHALMLRFPSAWDAAKNSKPGQVVAGEGKALIDLYQAEDDVFRLAAWLKAKEEGRTDMEAGKVARKSFMDYHINAPWVQALRNSALPFISYTYRAVPMMLETAAKKPHKLLKLMLLAGAVNALGVMIGGGGDDDERKLLPEEKAGRIWGMVPKLIRMPWNDVNGSPVYLDIRRFIPVGDVLDIGAGHAAVPLLPAMQPGGPLVILGEIIANRSMFTGKPINLETDTGMQATGKVIDHLWKAFAPNILGLPGTYATTGVLDAAKGKTDAFGREQSTAQAVASSFGVKLGSYPADVLRRNERAKAAAQVMEIDRNISALKRQRMTNRISNEDFQDQVRAENEKKRKVMQELQEKVSP